MKKISIILILVVVATLLCLPKHLERQKAEAAARDAEAQRIQFRQQVQKLMESLTTLREKLDSQTETQRQLSRAIAASERDFAKTDPESYWATPPVLWPQWDARSPYIWIRKEVLPRLPIQPFTSQGILIPEAVSVLAISEQQKATLDAELSKLTSDFHKLENEAAELSEDHLLGEGSESGEKITVKIKPISDEAARFRKRFEDDLKETLGSQRGELLATCADSWLSTQFDQSSKVPKTITMVRKENGYYAIAIRGDNSWLSMTGTREIVALKIPEHLLHFFVPILNSESTGGSVQPFLSEESKRRFDSQMNAIKDIVEPRQPRP